MKRFGIIGFPLKVSFSKAYFTKKFECEHLNNHVYELFPLSDISQFKDLLTLHPDLCGLNVTIPYKKTVMPYLDDLDTSAREVGAVNVIKFTKEGKLIGYNSDAFGFEQSFLPLLKPHHRSALILGTGGAAAAAASVLRKYKIPFQFVSRQKTAETLTYEDIHQNGFCDANILINTTPLGMPPLEFLKPDIPYEAISHAYFLFDMIYHPEKTLFLQEGNKRGAKILNGEKMFLYQAERSWKLWKKNDI